MRDNKNDIETKDSTNQGGYYAQVKKQKKVTIIVISVILIVVAAVVAFSVLAMQKTTPAYIYNEDGSIVTLKPDKNGNYSFKAPIDTSKNNIEEFVGWYDSTSTVLVVNKNGEIVVSKEDFEIYKAELHVVWNKIVYELKLDPKGGVISLDNNSKFELQNDGSAVLRYEYFEGDSIPYPRFVNKEGYVFEGWFVSESLALLHDSTTRQEGLKEKSHGDYPVLYAGWSQVPYSIAVNGPEGNLLVVPYAAGETIQESLFNSCKNLEGYEFEGFYTNSEYTQEFSFGSKMPASDLHIYAKFLKIEYTVEYKLLESSSDVDYENATLLKTNNVFFKDSIPAYTAQSLIGQIFSGWKIIEDNELVDYVIPEKMLSKNITVYGYYTYVNYNITYHLNDGINGDNPQTVTYVDDVILSSASKTGYEFKGWYLVETDGTSSDKLTKLNKITSDIDLYAYFVPEKKTITFVVNGVSDTVECDYDSMPEYDKDTPTKDMTAQYSYEFSGWSPELSIVKDNATYIADFTQTANTATVEFYGDGNEYIGSIALVEFNANISDVYDASEYLTPTKEAVGTTEYTFLSWKLSINHASIINNAAWTLNEYDTESGEFVIRADAVFQDNVVRYLVTLLDKDGVPLSSEYYEAGVDYVNITTCPNLTDGFYDYTDGYYFEVVDGQITDNKITESFIPNSAMTLKVVYVVKPCKYNIFYKIIGEDDPYDVVAVDYDTEISLIELPVETGYSFSAWSYDTNYTSMPNHDITITTTRTINSYSLTINYLYNGDSISESYSDMVEYNSAYSINSPIINGYSTDDLTVSSDHMAADNVVVNVIYTLITYTIDYTNSGVLEEENPSTYTIETEDITLLSPTKEGYSFKGWYTVAEPSIDDDAITVIAKGSYGNLGLYAVFEIVTYTIDYNYTGEFITTHNSYNIDTETFSLDSPTKVGYNFIGWFEKETPEMTDLPITQIAKGSTKNYVLYAIYEIIEYSIGYTNSGVLEGENPVTYTIETEDITLLIPTKAGYSFKGWYTVAEPSIDDDPITVISKGSYGNLSLYAVFEIVTYTIDYNYTGEFITTHNSYNIDTETFSLDSPQKAGYDFIGWYEKETPESTDLPITQIEKGSTKNYVLYAIYEIIEYSIDYTNSGVLEGENPVTYTIETEDITLLSPTKEGYSFKGWYTVAEPSIDDDAITVISKGSIGDLDLYAIFEIITYTITYHYNDGDLVANPELYTIETDDITLLDTQKVGYNFVGWYNVEVPTNTDVEIELIAKGSTGNIELYAVYEIKQFYVTVNYTYEIPDDSYTTQYKELYDYNSEYSVVSATIEGQTPSVAIVSGTMALEDVTVAVSYSANSYDFIVHFVGYSSEIDDYKISAKYNSKVEYDVPQKLGYESSSAKITVENMPAEEVENTITYTIITYTITYNNDGNAVVNPENYTIETSDITLANPTKTGYDFVGWYTVEEPLDTDETVEVISKGSTGDKELYAVYSIKSYTLTISYEYANGSEAKADETFVIEYNASYSQEIDAIVGYSSSLETVSSDHMPANDVNVTIIYTPIVYTIEYEYNGGDVKDNPESYTIETDTITLVDSQKVGYTFKGWYEVAEPSVGDEKVTKIELGSYGDLDLYAIFEIITYTVTYHLNCESVSNTNAVEYNVNSSAINLVAPTKTGYSFDSWYTTNDYTSMVTSFNASELKNLDFYGIMYTTGVDFVLNNNGDGYVVSGQEDKITISNLLIPFVYQGKPVVSIDSNAFYQIYAIETVEIPDTVISIMSNAFAGTGLKEVSIPSSVELIDNYAFAGCVSLTDVVVNEGVKTIGQGVFQTCIALKTIVLPTSVTSIGKNWIANTINFEAIYYLGTQDDFNNIAFGTEYSGEVYYYSETSITNGWHYVDGNIVKY